MPIRFLCVHCSRVLSIGRRKAGTSIECPKCGHTQTVPNLEAAQASEASAATDESPADADAPDAPCIVVGPPLAGRREDRGEQAPALVATPSRPNPLAGDWVVVSRGAVYVQGLILLGVALGGLGAGYLIGRGESRRAAPAVERPAPAEQVLVEGKLLYDTGTKLVGDGDAVMLLLPHGNRPELRFTAQPFRPHDPPPDEADPTWRRFSELGGVMARADRSGAFTVVVPRAGRYWMLLVSRHADRAESDKIEEVDRQRIEQYFVSADEIIGKRKYRWTLEEFAPGVEKVEYSFGIDGQDELSDIL